ncbi:Survival protein SurA-like protein [Bibersteinia trehalosi USDA-ARS-USMARC-188]|uniref:Survival protein SurA-like protein n=1 Tax=Bibersteinia trehalosi USDA-ARS-USMARC-188 TaxID=1263829 RepID=A0A4V7I932_BIBTR|nr:peptidylprolyl isomerase [Bibersteinia trehalosi]AHG81506.1 Survival protein SurA-like protein [Bibersteinia trehalosi USDA-ARS-USMARC-188]
MKFISLKSLFVATFALFAVSQIHAVEERVVASVDGHPIMQSQVLKMLGKRKNTEANRKAATDDLINDFLVQRAIQQSGIKVNTAYVDQVIENMVVQNGITYGQFLDYLDYNNISLNQYRQQIAHQILMDNVKQQAIGQSIRVEPQDVQSLATKMLEEAKTNGKLKTITALQHRVSHILIKTNPILNDAQAKAKLNSIVADIKAGKISFEDAARANSVDYASGAEGGDLGWNFLDAYDKTFAQTAQKSKLGVISAPFKSQFGWHVLKVTDTRQSDRTEDAYFQRAYEQLFDKQAQDASKDWVKALKNRAEIKYY